MTESVRYLLLLAIIFASSATLMRELSTSTRGKVIGLFWLIFAIAMLLGAIVELLFPA